MNASSNTKNWFKHDNFSSLPQELKLQSMGRAQLKEQVTGDRMFANFETIHMRSKVDR